MFLPEAHKVLLCLRYGIGDLVMQLPALTGLRLELPEAHITGIGSQPAIDLLEGDNRIDELVSVHNFGLTHWGDFGDGQSRSIIESWLRERDFDVIIDPSHATMGFGKAVWDLAPTRLLDASKVLEDRALETGGSGLDAIREAVRKGWGIEVAGDQPPHLPLGDEERKYARTLLNQSGMAGVQPYAVSPVASSPLKRWPLEGLAAVVRYLLDTDSDVRILILSGDQEELGRSLQQSIGEPERTAILGPVNLRRTGALLECCRGLLCNDTGLMHLGAAVGTPTVGMFGPTSSTIYTPPGMMGLGAGVSCPHRREKQFGPPRCIVEGRCLTGRRSCIDEIPVEIVCNTLKGVTQSRDG